MRRLICGALLAITCLGLCATSAWADLIGINFQGRGINNDGGMGACAYQPRFHNLRLASGTLVTGAWRAWVSLDDLLDKSETAA